MYCRHYMVRSAAATSTVEDKATLAEALAKMVKHHMQQLLVVNANGEFQGEITTFTLAKLLLPKEGEAGASREHAEAETVSDVDERIGPYLGHRVAEFIEHDLPVITPETPLTEALKHLVSGRLRLPVVDPATNKLVGVVSALTILRRYQF
jgi:CBS domain-containing protein